jgi:glycyl-tRNA synthetase beta chain
VSLPFLLEIGTEEIPDWMVEGALEQLEEQLGNVFQINKLPPAKLTKDGTPRRLILQSPMFPAGRPDIVTPEDGPLVSVGERAAQGFAKKYGVSVTELKVFDSPVGPKYRVDKRVPGESMLQILERSLEEVVLGIRWPKSMYWGEWGGPRFIRPIRWIVALLGDEVVPFEIAGVKSGNVTSGHRILGSAQIQVTIENYEQKLRENFVILSAKEREERIRAGIGKASDDDLLRTLVYLTEYPSVISGTFDKEYLKLPAEVLVTVMKHHQKYFAVYENGQLANRFLAVTNTDGDPDGLIRRGNERVLRARFNDAKFFWETDQKKKLADRVADLAHVTFQAKLGSYLEKTDRIKTLVKELGGDNHGVRAAELCKTDLTTELVKEFTELQGVVGGLYAREQGEPEEVWTAIYDHYKPVSMEDSIPRNNAGQLVSIADKLDTLRGCFGIGLIPTGSKDPFALRRAAQGIVKILVEGKLRFPIRKLLNNDAKLEEFLLDRIRYYFKDIRGFQYDEVNAILASGWNDLVDVEERLVAIQAVRPTEDFEPLAASFKRIQNILKQAQFTGDGGAIDASLLEPGPETDLYREFQNVRGTLANLPYRPALESIASLRPKVDLFFDKVLVNAPDPKIRHNRLTLLHTLLAEFSTIADFSEIVTNT